MDLKSIVSDVCDQADELLGDVTKRDEAKAGIAEWLTIHHPKLVPADRKVIIAQSMLILEREGFFERAAGDGE